MTRILSARPLRRALLLGGTAAMLAMAVTGCGEDSPTQNPSGFEAKGLVLRVASADSVVDSSSVRGRLDVQEGSLTDEFSALFIGKTSGARSTPTGNDYKLMWTVADSTIATIESSSSWSFKVRGRKAGSTTVTFRLLHGTAVAYTSAPIPVTVTAVAPPVLALKAGDTLTYDFYDRDTTTNSRIEATKRKRTWIVLQNGVAIYGRTNVTSILDITYTTAGTEFGTDTVYIQKGDDGSIWQYDLLRQMVLRIPNGDLIASSLTPKWVKMSSTSATTATTWLAIEGDSLAITEIPLQSGVNGDAMLKLTASHKGTQTVTVPAGSYADAFHTDHSLKFDVKVSGLGIPILNDSLAATFDYSKRDGVLRQTLQSRKVTAAALGQLQVIGFDMELRNYVHAK